MEPAPGHPPCAPLTRRSMSCRSLLVYTFCAMASTVSVCGTNTSSYLAATHRQAMPSSWKRCRPTPSAHR